MGEPDCIGCGHPRDAHKDMYAGICVGCPCMKYEPPAPKCRVCGASLDAHGWTEIDHTYEPEE